MRIAWIGGVSNGGGVGGIGALTLYSVLQMGTQVDYYHSSDPIPDYLLEYSNLNVVVTPSWWDWGKWYSNKPFTAFISSTVARTQSYNKLCIKVIENHENEPYDCIFQFSQTELFRLGRNLDKLPPIVVYPCVHAGGEYYWHGQEKDYALQVESYFKHYLIRYFLGYRTWLQKRELKKPTLVIGMSHRFNNLISKDYEIEATRQRVLYHPIRSQDKDVVSQSDLAAQDRKTVKLLFVSRMSVRKGLQYVIELSHRLDDLAGQVEIHLIGGSTQWSDYSGHLKDLNPNTAKYIKSMNRTEIAEAYSNADALLIPSVYEPGGIVVGEALSYGLCIVASNAIGSAEVLEGNIIREFPAGDMDRFEQEVRKLVIDLNADRQSLRAEARAQCRKHFSPDDVAKTLIAYLQEASEGNSRVSSLPQHSQVDYVT
jgi:glycosyltransferase involved in cell wall biosynthesis